MENNKEVNQTSDNQNIADNKREPMPMPKAEDFIYKFSPECKKTLHEYLNSCPMGEVEQFITGMFECADPDPFFTAQAIKDLSEYLRTRPRKEVKKIFEIMTAEGGLLTYKMTPKETTEVEEKE